MGKKKRNALGDMYKKINGRVGAASLATRLAVQSELELSESPSYFIYP